MKALIAGRADPVPISDEEPNAAASTMVDHSEAQRRVSAKKRLQSGLVEQLCVELRMSLWDSNSALDTTRY